MFAVGAQFELQLERTNEGRIGLLVGGVVDGEVAAREIVHVLLNRIRLKQGQFISLQVLQTSLAAPLQALQHPASLAVKFDSLEESPNGGGKLIAV